MKRNSYELINDLLQAMRAGDLDIRQICACARMSYDTARLPLIAIGKANLALMPKAIRFKSVPTITDKGEEYLKQFTKLKLLLRSAFEGGD